MIKVITLNILTYSTLSLIFAWLPIMVGYQSAIYLMYYAHVFYPLSNLFIFLLLFNVVVAGLVINSDKGQSIRHMVVISVLIATLLSLPYFFVHRVIVDDYYKRRSETGYTLDSKWGHLWLQIINMVNNFGVTSVALVTIVVSAWKTQRKQVRRRRNE